jgi:hypothetical protein
MTVIEIAVIVGVAIVALVLIAGCWLLLRHQSVRRRFGPEYKRLAGEKGWVVAERQLRQRKRRHNELELHPLDEVTRDRYRAAWVDIQARFADQPVEAVRAADDLVDQLAAERGYPVADHREKVEQLSVEHASVLERYRTARDVAQRPEHATTNELRQALLHYRSLFAQLLGGDPVEGGRTRRDEPDRETHPQTTTAKEKQVAR